MSQPADSAPLKPLYYLFLAVGSAALLGWFYLLRHWQLMEWAAQLGPETYKGSLNLLAIMLWMLPALLVWKYYLRGLNRYFDIRGQYDEDRHNAQYQHDADTGNQGEDSPPVAGSAEDKKADD